MALAQKIEKKLKRFPILYIVVAPTFYFLQFVYRSVRERSIWAYRYYPGHYGSPLPSVREVKKYGQLLFEAAPEVDDGVDLNPQLQARTLERMAAHLGEFAPPARPDGRRRYYHDNGLFGFNDGFVLYGMMRVFKPARIIEIGSGFSSALMVDTAEQYLPDCRFTFIDPYSPDVIPLLGNAPSGNFRIIRERIQDVSSEMVQLFQSLEADDILFIDSSHVVKIGSDLSTILFSILPSLKKGVLVHVHDIRYPFEYSEAAIMEGRAWNEIYFVRAFLQYNRAFEIVYFSSYAEREFGDAIARLMPGYVRGTGQSLWLRKVA
ncbi:MAG TPA: class I SAM-dependent methyltransferase [Xanthomonadaceae bacterium]|jgi:predicted O-methyltransferase YrrM